MIQIRSKDDIFEIDGGWFKGRWHFSFDQYYDPEYNSFGTLRVFNVDTLIPGAVWPMHPHRNIEVITYCLDGEFQHADDLGNDGILYPGDVQHTTVGRGIYHSEINHSQTSPMTFLQIWIFPAEHDLPPSVEQLKVKREDRLNHFLTLISNRNPNALPIQQDAEFIVAAFEEPGKIISHKLERGYGAYFYVISGEVLLNGNLLLHGDAAKVIEEPLLEVKATGASELAMVVIQV
ncbi:MAG: pirin family protein [Nitrospirota bacterium]|nr:pirin family protein [Nitrospirota bacterium]